jgi:hypothetical protein
MRVALMMLFLLPLAVGAEHGPVVAAEHGPVVAADPATPFLKRQA